MTYRMRDLQGDERFHRIYEGKVWAGRVYFDSIRGQWVGKIGSFEARGRNPIEAFGEVGAQVLGFKSSAALHDHNVRVRQRRHRRTEARESIAKLLYGATDDERVSALDEFITVTRA